jgi:hypothetical protein
MATVATLTFDLVAQSASLRSELAKANRHTKSWADQTRKVVNASAKAFAGLTVAGVAGLGAIYTQAANSADQLGKFSDKLGEAPEKIQGLQRAAQLTGVSVETTNMALQRMTRRTSEAAQGTGEAVNAIKELGLDAKELAKLSPADQFSKLSDAMKGVKSQGDRVRLAMKLFDSEGVSLVNTLDLGSKGLADIAKEVDEYGIALTRVDIAKIEAANDSWFRATEITSSFGNRIATQLSPIVGALANEFLNSAKEAGGLGGVAGQVVNYMVKAVGFAADTVRGLKVAWHGVKLVVAGVVSTIVEGMVAADRAVSSFLDALPGVEAKPSQMLQNISESLKSTYDDISNDLNESLLTPMPSEAIEEWVADVQSKAQAAAEKVAASKQSNIGNTLLNPEGQSAEGGEEGEGSNSIGPTESDLQTYESMMVRYQEVAANSSLYIEDSFVSAFDNISSNMSSVMATAIMEGESLKDGFGEVAKTLATDMLSGLLKVGTQMAVNAVMSKVFQAETAVTASAAGSAVAAAWAPAAALASLASFGSNAGPASAGIASTMGVASAVALTGMAHDGISEIPSEGTWLLDKGERVVSSQQNADLVEFLKSQSANRENINDQTFNFDTEEKVINIHASGAWSSSDVRELSEMLDEEVGDRISVRYIAV